MNRINCISTSYVEALTPIKSKESSNYEFTEEEIQSILHYPVMKEYASNPTVSTIAVNFDLNLQGSVTNESGLTVRNILDQVIRMWSTKASDNHIFDKDLAKNVEEVKYLDSIRKTKKFDRWIISGRPPVIFLNAYIVEAEAASYVFSLSKEVATV